jgi:hypothetical protein
VVIGQDDDREKRPQGPNFHLLEKLKEEMKKNFTESTEIAQDDFSSWDQRDGVQLPNVAKRQKVT